MPLLRLIKRLKLIKRGFLFSIVVAASVVLSNVWVESSTEGLTFDSISAVPQNDVALVLGTSKYARSGRQNLFFKYRMEAAAKLYNAGKVKHILVSGDNHVLSYDEATDMKKHLMRLGVPEGKITLDYAGFRTLDSVVRSKQVFGLKKLTVVSQAFHNQRALFICKRYGIDAVGYNAQEVPVAYSKKTYIREYIARFVAVMDLYLLMRQPKFLGKKEPILV